MISLGRKISCRNGFGAALWVRCTEVQTKADMPMILMTLLLSYYTEMIFPEADVRFIAINNGVDSASQQDSDFTPFLNIINEWYAKDTSKKIREVFKAKGQSGKSLSTIPPYGYIKDPKDKNHWIVDEEAAEVVREIFHLCVSGYGPTRLANELQRRKILTSVEYAKSKGWPMRSVKQKDDPFAWETSTVVHILERQEYLGNTVNFKTYRKSYKQKKTLRKDPSEWQIFEGTHEAIIDKETFAIVQRIQITYNAIGAVEIPNEKDTVEIPNEKEAA